MKRHKSTFLKLIVYCSFLVISLLGNAQHLLFDHTYVSFKNGKDCFELSGKSSAAPLYIDSADFEGVKRALQDLKTDIGRVTSNPPAIYIDIQPKSKRLVIIGTLGRNKLLDRLIKSGKIDVSQITGKWESYLIQVVKKPWQGVEEALVIAGSDKRGSIYGIYDLSTQIGVSPWYWWADVPVVQRDAIFIKHGKYVQGPPSVKYRGIFLNDEYPALTRWVEKKFGKVPIRENPPTHKGIANYNREFYSRIFELILRLKGNYLWPAMWNNAFNEDDPENPRLADEYGIVMGTSHQEPMLRAQKEWDRRYLKTLETWNYATHPEVLENFWREGVRRNKDFESIITMGLRGANDTEMAPGGPEANMALLEKIVSVQRKIIADEMNPDVTKVPQLWCLYKEVQDFYEAGMRVPDDITLLWAEDNWGNVRRLPTAEERKRSGGAGVYYHFDYHGGPRSYQWINTSPIPKIWDQMSLAKQYGADRIWIVNVGHFKGYEFPLEFFMNLAWQTDKYTNDNLDEYTRQWAAREFGQTYASDIADIIIKYTQYNGRRKPELLAPSTYSLVNYNEAEKVVADFNSITAKAEAIFSKLNKNQQDAFYQLVLFPTKASALVNELYLSAAKNILFAKQKRASTNDFAAKTQELFTADTSLMGHYNRVLAGGKWNHFMDQAHLGYTSWNDPPENSLRAIPLTQIELPDSAAMGIAVEGSEDTWPGASTNASLPEFDIFNKQEYYIDIFNKGHASFNYSVSVSSPWVLVNETQGKIDKEKRILVKIDWNILSKGKNQGYIEIKGTNSLVKVDVSAFNPSELSPDNLHGFVESNGYVSMEAEHFTKNTNFGESKWMLVEDYGHTLSGIRATATVDAPAATPGTNAPCLEYQMYLFTTGKINVTITTSPVLNFMADRPIRYAVSFDNEMPQIITLVSEKYKAQNGNWDWEKSVANNARNSSSTHTIKNQGYHTLKIWMIDPGVVLQKLIVDFGGAKKSYLGPPESFYK